MKTFVLGFLLTCSALAQELPGPPSASDHPGSKQYSYSVERKDVRCDGRDVVVFYPREGVAQELPLVVYGHGQALGVEHYEQTLRHLAGKGAIAVHPQYDKGFFDQDWDRMGRDFVSVTDCALAQLGLRPKAGQVLFTGHSKGAYVAGVAAGVAVRETSRLTANAVILFQPAGLDETSWPLVHRETKITIVNADQDTIVDRAIAEKHYQLAPADRKQLIILKSYGTKLAAKHFWPLTKKSAFGGSGENSFHYYGSWKWLTAAVWDLQAGDRANSVYLYGDKATDKGFGGLADDLLRNF
jgi:alpha/beta superfamily hydrolase